MFSNLEGISTGYEIPKDVKEKIDSDILDKMKLLADTYNTKDPKTLYESLKQLRYVTTKHQLTVWQSYDTPPKFPRRVLKSRG